MRIDSSLVPGFIAALNVMQLRRAVLHSYVQRFAVLKCGNMRPMQVMRFKRPGSGTAPGGGVPPPPLAGWQVRLAQA